tara:strand:- start:24 stop:287 length:264 start_codon:yes stop_codon:yes gene_type:complete
MPIYNVQVTRTTTQSYTTSLDSTDEPTAARTAINEAKQGGFQMDHDEINTECQLLSPASSYVPLVHIPDESSSQPTAYTSIRSLLGD